MNQPADKKFSKAELRQYVSDYLLAIETSPMSLIANEILAAHTFGLPIKLIGSSRSDTREIELVLKALDIHYTVDINKSLWDVATGKSASRYNHSLLNPSEAVAKVINILAFPRDHFNFGKLIPFYFQKNIWELGQKDSINIDKIDILFLFALKQVLSDNLNKPGIIPNVSLDRLTFDAILNAQTANYSEKGVIALNSILLTYPYIINGFFQQLENMSPVVLTYAGFECKYERFEDICFAKEIKNHPINVYLRSEIKRRRMSTSRGGTPHNYYKPPYLKRIIYFGVDDLVVVAQIVDYLWNTSRRNVLNDERPEVDSRVLSCLQMRLSGKQEEIIAKALGFKNDQEYGEWLHENHIDIISQKPCSIFDDWKTARDALGIENIKLDPLPEKQESKDPRSESVLGQFREKLRKNPNFRFPRLADNKRIVEKKPQEKQDETTIKSEDGIIAASAAEPINRETKLFVYEDDFTVVFAGKKYNLPDKHFRAVMFMINSHKDGNPSLAKHAIYNHCDVNSPSTQAMSIRKWFIKHGGEAERFANDCLIEVDLLGNCHITIKPEFIIVKPHQDIETDSEKS